MRSSRSADGLQNAVADAVWVSFLAACRRSANVLNDMVARARAIDGNPPLKPSNQGQELTH